LWLHHSFIEVAPFACRTGATAATWSLQRLDALAADVIDVLQQEHPQTLATDDSSSSSKPAAAPAQVLAGKFPMQVLSAVNSVLFGRQGYAACNRYGTPSDSQLATVLESGPGSCAALTVLYLEVRTANSIKCNSAILSGALATTVLAAQAAFTTTKCQQKQLLLLRLIHTTCP
jgi:hypothetical protein